FSLQAFEPCLDDTPLRAVDHNWNPRDLRFTADQIQEADHGRLRVDHPFVHVHVEEIRAALHLLTRYSQSAVEIARENQLRKLRRSRNIGALADDNEAELRRNVQRFEPGKSQNHAELVFLSTARGENFCVIFAAARMCPGVVPQQPPPMLSQPFSTHLATLGAKV